MDPAVGRPNRVNQLVRPLAKPQKDRRDEIRLLAVGARLAAASLLALRCQSLLHVSLRFGN